MTQTIAAHFDGRVIVPDEPVQMPVGRPLLVRLEVAAIPSPRFSALLDFAADLPDAPDDLAARHDDYLSEGTER